MTIFDLFCHLSPQKCPLYTNVVQNFVHLDCWGDKFYPTYNGVDPFDKIECTKTGWSLPDDMKPIMCKHITCPPIPYFGEEIETTCTYWDESCHWNLEADESTEDCMCHQAVSRCTDKYWSINQVKIIASVRVQPS